MKKNYSYPFKTKSVTLLADTITPVSIYLKIRDIYPNSLLLESSDYRGNENSYSFICLKPVAAFEVEEGIITESYPDGERTISQVSAVNYVATRLNEFSHSFENIDEEGIIPVNGLFGYTSYDAVKYFDKIRLESSVEDERRIPDIHYSFYSYIIAINHFQNTLYIIENRFNESSGELDRIISLINSRNIAVYPFSTAGDETSNISDREYMSLVSSAIHHCHRGDVFQVVMSRQFARRFTGDDFNVYRALRSVNPSPYLFYFDYGSFRIFGSSPESQLKISGNKAYINPIAGTFRRSGNDENDKKLALQLATDEKENAEHVMLVDLARNDLSRHAGNVMVDNYRQVQFYSHVIHLVSSVSGDMREGASMIDMMTATFPAGTLTGAPKYRAIQLIDQYEKTRRGYYGGAIGFIDFRGKLNHAIMIRTFLSKGSILFYQAGAGIVAGSGEESELQEVNNKLGALRIAVEKAMNIK